MNLYENWTAAPVHEQASRSATDVIGVMEGGGNEEEEEVRQRTDSLTSSLEPHNTLSTTPPSTVWLSDSWKYNTIKKAPDFNLFDDFSDIDSTKGEKQEKEEGGVEEEEVEQMIKKKEKRSLRSRLPTFSRKKDKKENKTKGTTDGGTSSRIPHIFTRGTKGENRDSQVAPPAGEEGRPQSTITTLSRQHKRSPLSSVSQTFVRSTEGGARSKEHSPCSSDIENRMSKTRGGGGGGQGRV